MKILYIEDDQMQVDVLREQLRGFVEVHAVSNLEEGRKQASDYFHAIVADISGTEVFDFHDEIERIKHKNIVLTSSVFQPMKNEHKFIKKIDLVKTLKSWVKN